MIPKAGSTEGTILNYVNQQNRPLNTQVIADALQDLGIKKTAVQKVLDTLSENGTISFKDFGKQRIYLANQDQFEIPSMEELDQMRQENERLRGELAEKKTVVRELETEVRMKELNLTDCEIRDTLERLTNEIAEKSMRLSNLKAGIVLVRPEERKQVQEAYEMKVFLWKKRKRIFKDLWDLLGDAVPTDLSEFKEETGIATDEDVGLNLEDYCGVPVKKHRR